MDKNYSTREIAEECGVSRWMVTRFLRRDYPEHHHYRTWWRLSEADYEAVCATLRSAKASCPKQPLHALERPQMFMVF